MGDSRNTSRSTRTAAAAAAPLPPMSWDEFHAVIQSAVSSAIAASQQVTPPPPLPPAAPATPPAPTKRKKTRKNKHLEPPHLSPVRPHGRDDLPSLQQAPRSPSPPAPPPSLGLSDEEPELLALSPGQGPEVLGPDDLSEGELVEEDEAEAPHFRSGHLFAPEMFPKLAQMIGDTLHMGGTSQSEPSVVPSGRPGLDVNSVFPEPKEAPGGFAVPPSIMRLIQKEWSGQCKDTRIRTMKFYKLAQEHAPLFQLPVVDAPVAALGNPTTIQADSEGFPKNPLDKMTEVAARKSFEAASGSLRAALSATLASRSIVLWCQNAIEKYKLPKEAASDFRCIAAMAAFSADATADSIQLSARAMTSAVAVRRTTWLRNWDVELSAHNRLVALPFKGEKLFGELLEPFLLDLRGNRKVLPSRPQPQARRQSYRPRSFSFRPYRPRQENVASTSGRHTQPPAWQPTRPRGGQRSQPRAFNFRQGARGRQ